MTHPTWLGPIRQSAFIVDDIDAAAMEWVQTQGVGPFFTFEIDYAETTYRGRTVPLRNGLALAQSGVQQVELIAPDRSQQSVYTEYIDAGGTGLHHVCYWADLDRAISHFEQVGCVLVQDGVTGLGHRFAYMTGTAGVPYIELVNPTGGMAALFESVAAAAVDWNGDDPLRR